MLKILSISIDLVFVGEVDSCVCCMGELMTEVGLETEIFEIKGYLIVYGECFEVLGVLIVFVYGYYDV